MNDENVIIVFLRAYARKDVLTCTKIIGEHLNDLDAFTDQLVATIREGLYAGEVPVIKSIGLNNSVDLLGACLERGNREVILLKAVARRGILAPAKAEEDYQKNLRVQKEEDALDEGLRVVGDSAPEPMSKLLDQYF